jgi:hypothetical protein
MEEKQVDIIVRKLYSVTVLAHITHENIRCGFIHDALGEFYDSINDVKDRFIEHLMGTGKMTKVTANILEISEDIITDASNLQYMIDSYCKQSGDNALINISGDYIEALGKLKFKYLMD